MSDADWIEKAAQQVVDDVHSDLHICRSPSKSIADAIETIRRFHAAHIASYATDKLAERIAEACYDADGTIISVGIVEEILAPLLARNAAMEAVLLVCGAALSGRGYLALQDRIRELTAKGAGQ